VPHLKTNFTRYRHKKADPEFTKIGL